MAAERALRAALDLDPGFFDARLSLAFLYRDLGRLDEAAALFDPWLESHPWDANLLGRVAQFLDAIGDPDRARACYAEAIRVDPGLAPAWFEHGRLLLQSGRFDEAVQCLCQTLSLDPTQGPAYLLLVQTRRFTAGDPLMAFIEQCARKAGSSPATRACLHFAHGKIFDDLGRWDQALAEITEANALRRQEIPFDRMSHEMRLRQILAIPTDFWNPKDPHPASNHQPAPLFIVGLPRAGTTLLEQLLVAHPAISTIGESDTLPLLLESLGLLNADHTIHIPEPPFRSGLTEAAMVEVLSGYRMELTRGVPAGVRYVIDKNPLNFWHVGWIRKIFPDASILALERDPRDVLLSLYFQNFSRPELAFSYAIPDIQFYLNTYRSLMTHWQHAFGPRLRTVRYETLVHEPVTVVNEILAGLGLDPAGSQNTPEQDLGMIRTASAWQARQPVYLRSVGRWKPYAQGLLERYPELTQLGITT